MGNGGIIHFVFQIPQTFKFTYIAAGIAPFLGFYGNTINGTIARGGGIVYGELVKVEMNNTIFDNSIFEVIEGTYLAGYVQVMGVIGPSIQLDSGILLLNDNLFVNNIAPNYYELVDANILIKLTEYSYSIIRNCTFVNGTYRS